MYVVSRLFHTNFIIKSHATKSVPTVTEQDAFTDFLSEFPTQDKPADLEFYALSVPIVQRYQNLQDKVYARKNLDFNLDPNLVLEVCELMRKFLGLAQPERSSKIAKFTKQSLFEITETNGCLKDFIHELKTAIKDLFLSYFKGMHYTKIQFILKKLKGKNITASDIASIKAQFHVLSNFH